MALTMALARVRIARFQPCQQLGAAPSCQGREWRGCAAPSCPGRVRRGNAAPWCPGRVRRARSSFEFEAMAAHHRRVRVLEAGFGCAAQPASEEEQAHRIEGERCGERRGRSVEAEPSGQDGAGERADNLAERERGGQQPRERVNVINVRGAVGPSRDHHILHERCHREPLAQPQQGKAEEDHPTSR